MLKILIIIFESSFGHNTIYVSNNYALYSMNIGDVKDETLYNLLTKTRYEKVNGRFVAIEIDTTISDFFKVDKTEVDTRNIDFMGYESYEITGTISKNNYSGKFKEVYSYLPIIDDFVHKEPEKLFLPLTKVINSKILFRTYIGESHNGSFDENTIVLEELKSIDTINVELDFFTKLIIED